MSRSFLPLTAVLLSLCFVSKAQKHEFKTHISKSFTVDPASTKKIIGVYNVFGDVEVQGYKGDKVLFEIDETISASTEADLETGKKEFVFSFDNTGDTLMAFVDEPYQSRPRHWSHEHQHDIRYVGKLHIIVKVPQEMGLDAATVNDGNVTVTDMLGSLNVNNVNGSVTINKAKGTTNACTINGKVNVNYLSDPPGNSSYRTINGDIRVTYPNSLSADIRLKSMNGNYYTDFDNIQGLPANVIMNKESRNGGTQYKLDATKGIRIGSGGKKISFETLNGNIYIKKQS